MLDAAQLTPLEPTGAEDPAASREIMAIPLNRLILSSLNVRRTERDADVASLAEDIAARGLKQNLVVTPAHFSTGEGTDPSTVDWAYQLEVIAGGRRFQAMQLLVADGRLAEDHPVPCMIEQRGEARETSLSENLHRVAMNPADEFDAFAAIVAQLDPSRSSRAGSSEAESRPSRDDAIAQCAKRFGVTVKHVAGRLRLAALAPEILEALRGGTLNLESAKAYAVTADHKLQLKVFKDQAKSNWKTHDPRTVRDALRGRTVALTDGRVLFVGLDAYVAAGGRVEAEMFMGTQGEERLVDSALLDKLAKDQAADAIAARAKADGFKEGLFASGSGYNTHWPKAPDGLEKKWDHGSTVSKAQKKKSVGVYSIAHDGTLKYDGRFGPAEQRNTSTGYKAPTPEEIAAERRKSGIATIAARLAVGSFAGSPLEGRGFWPAKRWIDPIEQVNDDEVYVAVLVRVSPADIDAQREAAEAKYDAELAEAVAEQARAASEVAAERGDGLDQVIREIEAAESDEDELAD